MLERENILKIYEIEENFKSLEKWPQVCLATAVDDLSCSPGAHTSALIFLSLGGYNGNIADITQDQIDTAFTNCMETPEIWKVVMNLIQSKELINQQGGRVEIVRSFMTFGTPLNVNGI